jgi:hypothetical protein
MVGSQSPQDDFGQQADTATPGGAPEQRPAPEQSWQQSQDAQSQDAQSQDAQSQVGDQQYGGDQQYSQPQHGGQQYGQPQSQQMQPYAQQQPVATGPMPPATGLTSAQRFWYVVQCIAFGAGYFMKIPPKKALADYGMAQLTPAEEFWYILQCCAFGAGYFKKLSTAKALSEMPQFQTADHRR